MSKSTKDGRRRESAPAGKVWVRFVVDCTHCHLPFKAGDEIVVEEHWAQSIETIGSGYRIQDSSPASGAKE